MAWWGTDAIYSVKKKGNDRVVTTRPLRFHGKERDCGQKRLFFILLNFDWCNNAWPGIFEHGGFMDGTRTHIWLAPGARRGAVFLSNGDGDYSDISEAVHGFLLGSM